MAESEKTTNIPVPPAPQSDTPPAEPVPVVAAPAPVVVPDAPKPEAPKPAPKKFTPDEIREAEKVVTQTYYKLNFRNASGSIRGDINKEVVRQLSSRWSDLLRIIPQHRWIAFEEILQMAWDFENRSLRKLYNRTRKQVEEGVQELLDAGVLEKKN